MGADSLFTDILTLALQLEACYLEALEEGGALTGGEFGGNKPEDDMASLLTASWRETRSAILNYGGISEFNFRQFLFVRQARLLMTLWRPTEMAERAMKFVQNFSGLLLQHADNGNINPNFREVQAALLPLSSFSQHFTANLRLP